MRRPRFPLKAKLALGALLFLAGGLLLWSALDYPAFTMEAPLRRLERENLFGPGQTVASGEIRYRQVSGQGVDQDLTWVFRRCGDRYHLAVLQALPGFLWRPAPYGSYLDFSDVKSRGVLSYPVGMEHFYDEASERWASEWVVVALADDPSVVRLEGSFGYGADETAALAAAVPARFQPVPGVDRVWVAQQAVPEPVKGPAIYSSYIFLRGYDAQGRLVYDSQTDPTYIR